MIDKILANPENWFPPVDQVDRPYFIVIDDKNRVYSEFTNFNILKPVTASENNWYEEIDQDHLKYFLVKGRCGYYWMDFETGLFYMAAQHEEGSHEIKHYVLALEVQGKFVTAKSLPEEDEVFVRPNYKMVHFKNSFRTMRAKEKTMNGMNCRPPVPVEKKDEDGKTVVGEDGKAIIEMVPIRPEKRSQTAEVVFGWEFTDLMGRLTLEGVVYNRPARFDLRLIYSLPKDYPVDKREVEFRLYLWDALKKQERVKPKKTWIKKGERFTWQERIL